MKGIFLVIFLFTVSSANAALTVGNVPRTKTGGTTPKLEDSSITSSGSNVGVGSTNPVATLDVNGVVKATSFQASSTDAGTVQWFEAAANGSNYISWGSQSSLSTNLEWKWPPTTGTAGQVLMRDSGSGTNWSDLTAVGNITGSGTANKVTKWTSTTAIGDSVLTEISSNIGIGSASPRTTLDVNGGAYIAGTGGNVGIGTATPTATLEVNGTFAVRGAGTSKWSKKTGTNTACDTTCSTSGCAFGVDDTNKLPLACSDATADTCICMGP